MLCSSATRREEVAGIKAKFPTKIPVIVERYSKETTLPVLDKTKFLVPQELTMSQFVSIIRYVSFLLCFDHLFAHLSWVFHIHRNRMQITQFTAFYLMVNNKSMASMSKTLAEVYRENRDEDGFLYMTYASQEMFGSQFTPEPL